VTPRGSEFSSVFLVLHNKHNIDYRSADDTEREIQREKLRLVFLPVSFFSLPFLGRDLSPLLVRLVIFKRSVEGSNGNFRKSGDSEDESFPWAGRQHDISFKHHFHFAMTLCTVVNNIGFPKRREKLGFNDPNTSVI
jgi:hypothetical protein